MLPAFNEDGYLPAGAHPAGLDEVEARFGRDSELRRAQMQSLRWLADLVRRAGMRRFVIDGSFVSDLPEPNDVDCVLLAGAPLTQDLEDEFAAGLPFLQVIVAEQEDLDYFVNEFFATDRHGVPKGVVEVML